MSVREFTDWMALYNLEAREAEQAQKDAQAKAKAEGMARQMRGMGSIGS